MRQRMPHQYEHIACSSWDLHEALACLIEDVSVQFGCLNLLWQRGWRVGLGGQSSLHMHSEDSYVDPANVGPKGKSKGKGHHKGSRHKKNHGRKAGKWFRFYEIPDGLNVLYIYI